jgi:uncharacterized protein
MPAGHLKASDLQKSLCSEKWQLDPTAMDDIDRAIESPCVRNCCLDDDNICLGCFRSIDEIKQWGLANHHERLLILQNAKQRRVAHQTQAETGRIARPRYT